MKVVVVLVVLFGLSGCGVWTAVVGDPREAGPQIEALETRNPVVSDIELESGDRIKFSRHDGGSEGVSIASDSGRYSMTHRQSFVPVDGRTLDDVVAEVLATAEAAGWEMHGSTDSRSYCGERTWGSAGSRSDTLKVWQGDVGPIGEDTIPAVLVGMGGPGRCNFETSYTEPWEG